MGLVAFELPPPTLEARSYHTVPSPYTRSSRRWRSRGNSKSAIGGMLVWKGVYSVATGARREWWWLACSVHRDGYLGRLLRPLYAVVEHAHSQLQVHISPLIRSSLPT